MYGVDINTVVWRKESFTRFLHWHELMFSREVCEYESLCAVGVFVRWVQRVHERKGERRREQTDPCICASDRLCEGQNATKVTASGHSDLHQTFIVDIDCDHKHHLATFLLHH